MSKLSICKGDLICRYWSEFVLLALASTAIFGLATLLF